MRTSMNLTVSEDDRVTLERWVKSGPLTPKQFLRAQMVLMTAEGRPTQVILNTLKILGPTLNLWRGRYQDAAVMGAPFAG